MDHATAVREEAAEKYLLGQLSPMEEDDFEAHYFGCEECAEEVRTGLTMRDTAHLLYGPQAQAAPVLTPVWADEIRTGKRASPWFRWRLQPTYALAASVVLLGFLVYQYVSVLPRLRASAAPRALSFYSLSSGMARGGVTALRPPEDQPFILLVDAPVADQPREYLCDVLDGKGNRLFSVKANAAANQATIPLLIPAAGLTAGSYSLVLVDTSSGSTAKDQPEAARYEFTVEK